jgi:soluble lytic murein transglycosylase-like protein
VFHYTPNPLASEEYLRTAAAEAEIAARLPKLSIGSEAGLTAPMQLTTPIVDARAILPSMEMRMVASRSLRGHSTGDELIDSLIVDSSRRHSVDPLLILAQMSQESSFRPEAVSHKGAAGLMQLMPFTARRMGVTNIYDPQQNIEGGVKYMRLLLNMFDEDVALALAGYNAGEGAVIKYGNRIPPYQETIDYVRKISARYRALSDAKRNEGSVYTP